MGKAEQVDEKMHSAKQPWQKTGEEELSTSWYPPDQRNGLGCLTFPPAAISYSDHLPVLEGKQYPKQKPYNFIYETIIQ